jgi:hypothetical protein
MTKEEIYQAALEAFPIKIMYGGGRPSYDDNEEKRKAFIKGFEFRQWLHDCSFSNPYVPLHIKFRIFVNQMKAKKQ